MKTLACMALAFGIVQARDVKVEITDQGFQPRVVEVTEGQKVIWMNMTKSEQTVTARAPAGAEQQEEKPLFDSGPIQPGGTFEHTFDKAGTYSYGSTMDRTMTGVVVVKARD